MNFCGKGNNYFNHGKHRNHGIILSKKIENITSIIFDSEYTEHIQLK